MRRPRLFGKAAERDERRCRAAKSKCSWCLQPIGESELDAGIHKDCVRYRDPKATGRMPPTGNQDDDPMARYRKLQEEVGPVPSTPEEIDAAILRADELRADIYGKKEEQPS